MQIWEEITLPDGRQKSLDKSKGWPGVQQILEDILCPDDYARCQYNEKTDMENQVRNVLLNCIFVHGFLNLIICQSWNSDHTE